MSKHNLSVGIIMMLINEGYIDADNEDEAVESVNDLLTDWFALSSTDLDFPWDEDQNKRF